jgi:sirohydrochlorin cobaltochelatase
MPAAPAPDGPALLIIGHGTRDATGVAQFRQLIGRVRDRAAGWLPAVDGGFIELAAPPVGEVVSRLAGGRLADGGPGELVAVPLVLSAAGHGKGDIPAALAREQMRHPGLRYRYGRPLGPHPVLVDLLAHRLAECGAVDGDPVVLVAGGSLDPDANAQVAATARLLWEGRGFASVEVAFASTTRPTVPEALERLRLLGLRRAAVARYFLGPGRLPAAVARAAASVDGIDVVVSEPLGVSDSLVSLVLARYDEALTSDIRMNCDVCLYRVPMPGRESAVGAPQVPHRHPDDA